MPAVCARRRQARTLATATGVVHAWRGEVVGSPFTFRAGQYLNFLHPSGVAVPFSIASPPAWLPLIDVHYAPTPGHAHTPVMDELIHAEAVMLSEADGNCTVDGTDTPLLLVATGTGIGQALSIALDQHARGRRADLRVVRHVQHEDDRYLHGEIHAHLQASGAPLQDCVGPRTALLDWLAAQLLAASTTCVLTGDPDWVWAVHDSLVARGIPPGQIRSDVFIYAPRPDGGGPSVGA